MIPIHGKRPSYRVLSSGVQDSDVSARIIRSLYNTARQYRESFVPTAPRRATNGLLLRARIQLSTPLASRSRKYRARQGAGLRPLLPEEIQPFTGREVYDSDEKRSFTQGGGHGSHPHLVHEFVSALLDKREPYPNAAESANITCVGILAHESAMEGRALKQMPEFTLKGRYWRDRF